jgi:capsid protein
LKDLNDALAELATLTGEGAAVPTANTNWQTAKGTYTNALAAQVAALAAQADYQTSNADLKTGKTTSVLLQATANQTAVGKAIVGL